MKLVTNYAEYNMEKREDSFTFSVKEKHEFSAVEIEHISEKGAVLFIREIAALDVRACQLVAVAEDKALSAVTEIFSELL